MNGYFLFDLWCILIFWIYFFILVLLLSHGLCCCTWGTEISVIFSGNWTFSISWLVTGMFSFVISGNTLMSKAEIRVTIPAKALTTNEEWRSFSSPIIIPVIAPRRAAPEQIPVHVDLKYKLKLILVHKCSSTIRKYLHMRILDFGLWLDFGSVSYSFNCN